MTVPPVQEPAPEVDSGLLLPDANELVQFLQSTLEQLEAAQGGIDVEARSRLNELIQATSTSRVIGNQNLVLNEDQLESQIQSLSQQLSHIEQQVASADGDTLRLLSQSTSIWAGNVNEANES